MSRFAPGQLVSDKFRVLSVLGEGAMGTVYAVEHLTLRVNVALKVLGRELARRPDQVERFLREGVAISRVRHRAVVQVYDAGEHDGQPWIAMELLEGETLRARMARQRPSAKEAAALMIEVLGGLAAAHAQGIVHRDVKPTNIFLARQPEGTVQPKLLDFGIALVMDVRERLTGAGMMMGTLSYMAPEQIHAARDVDPRADLYAVGAILHEALGGRPPYAATSVTELVTAIASQPAPDLARVAPHQPRVMIEVVNRCLALDREHRPRDARQLSAMLEAALRLPDEPASVPATLRIAGAGAAARVDPMAQTTPGAGVAVPAQGWAQAAPSASDAAARALGGAWSPPAQATPPHGAWPAPGAHPPPPPPQGSAWSSPHAARTTPLPEAQAWTPAPPASYPGAAPWQGPSAPGGSWPGSPHPGSPPSYADPFFPPAPPRSPLWHLAWILPLGLVLMGGTGYAVVAMLEDDDPPSSTTSATTAAVAPEATPAPVAPPPTPPMEPMMMPIDPAQPQAVPPEYPVALAPTPVAAPAPHACIGTWSGPLLQSDGPRGSGVVTIHGAEGSCGGFVERWASGARCDYRLLGCRTDGPVLSASAHTPAHQRCSPVRMRFTCEGGRMRFHEEAGRVTVTSTMSPRRTE